MINSHLNVCITSSIVFYNHNDEYLPVMNTYLFDEKYEDMLDHYCARVLQ